MSSLENYQPKPFVTLKNPNWIKNASIYEINIRQFTEEGTFKAAETHLPRLKELGVDILWLMPIHEIGIKNRKGILGSPYSVKDYYSVNPEFGSFKDLKDFVHSAHGKGFRVILDWVANHTAWDNVLVEKHPEWYARDWKGDFRPTPWWDWTDIIDLDYNHAELRKYMTEAMCYWVREADIDGFRADVAGLLPNDFWEQVRSELEKIKPVFMLAEWESRDLHAKAFDMTYAWTWWDAVYEIAKGRANLNALYKYYSWNERAFPKESIRMTFVSNHDKNSWDGTMFENFGEALEAAIVLSVTGDGMPLIYNGQETGNSKRLAFFEKDPIEWKKHKIGDLYKKLLMLKKENPALWNGRWGATMIKVPNTEELQVLSFVRQNERDKAFITINFSSETKKVAFKESLHCGKWTEYFSGESVTFDVESELELGPWSYLIYTGSNYKG